MGDFFVDVKIIMLIIDITRIKVAIDPNSGITLTPIIFTSLEFSDNGTYIVVVPSTIERMDFGSFCPSTYTNMGNSITSDGIIDTFYDGLKSAYWMKTSWIANRRSIGDIRNLKD